jgi:hypothetical protein
VAPARLLAAGAAYAAAELGIALLFGFFSLGRAEALLFFAVRPWLLIGAAALAAGLPLQRRAIFYGAALILAGISESIFVAAVGAENPLPEAGRGLVAAGMLVILVDAAVQIGRRFVPRGTALAAFSLGALLLVPGSLRPYEGIALGAGEREAPERRDLMLMSALPLMWGEAGPLDPNSRRAAIFPMLEKEFAIRPLDVLDDRSLSSGWLLLLAQPRALAPAELVALDSWVRRGGRALILTDPALFWPSELPLGDIRRPPAMGLLAPLLAHWGLRLDEPEERKAVVRQLNERTHERRLVMFAPGRFVRESGSCAVEPPGQLARCRLGKGEALLVADADMMHDRLWAGPGSDGTERHARISDNPLLVADWLDRLWGRPRPRAAAPVQWLGRDSKPARALLLALLPLALAAAPTASRAITSRR